MRNVSGRHPIPPASPELDRWSGTETPSAPSPLHLTCLPSSLFVRTVDMVQSLPKQGPIQTSYEEKLALYSLYKQATEGDVQSKRPGMLDMLGRAKWDAWAKVRGLPSRDAKQMYVESMLRILRRFGDRPQAAALIEELEAFSGQVAQRVMDGSLVEVDSDGSTLSTDESDTQPSRPPPLNPAVAPRPSQDRQRMLQRSGVAGSSSQSLRPPMSSTGVSTAATRGGNPTSLAATPLASESQESSSDDDHFEPSMHAASPLSGQPLDRFAGHPGQPAQRPYLQAWSGAPRSLISSPPPSTALGLQTNRPSSVSGVPNRYHSTLQSPAPSSYAPHQREQRAPEPQQRPRSTYAPSSIGGRSGRAGPSSQPIPRPPSMPSFPPPHRAEIEMALQSIQASLAALHERLNQVENAVPGRHGGDEARHRRNSGSGSATELVVSALSNFFHDVGGLLGIGSGSQRSPRTEALAPSFLASGGQGGGRRNAAGDIWSASIKLVVALLNLAARLALDVISFALVSSVFLFAFKKVTGRGDPLLALRVLGRARRVLLRRPAAAAIASAPAVQGAR
ncbi:hypothetical protein ACQY0O_005250 [Thecaphora frezii]